MTRCMNVMKAKELCNEPGVPYTYTIGSQALRLKHEFMFNQMSFC